MSDGTMSCNLCGYSDFITIEDNHIPFRVVRCRHCSLVFVHPQPERTTLNDHYDETYYYQWMAVQRTKRVKMWHKRLEKLGRFRSGGELLDVGCGEGLFLELARNIGWKIHGTETSSYGAKYASDRLRNDIFCGELSDAGYSDNSFDVVTMWHVLEHVTDPLRYLTEIYRVLRPGGVLILAVPNVNNVVMRIVYRIFKGKRLTLFSPDDKELHLYHFSPETLRAYLDKTHFGCLSVSPDYGIIEGPKKIVNLISAVPYYCAGIHVYNAIEVFSVSKKE